MSLTRASAAVIKTEEIVNNRNRIINGDMRIDQRNAGAAVTSNGAFPVDRFLVSNSTDGAFSAQQDSSVPTGFVTSLKYTTTTADASVGATQWTAVRHKIEGTNVYDLAWGTANAKTVTLSFWVRSSLTGTFGVSITNSGQSRTHPATYTISVADTWEYKTITIAGDTTGTWLTTNGVGIEIFWGLGVGSTYSGTAGSWSGSTYLSATGATNLISTLNATWYITGVQLEVGSVATPFERRPYGTELALCQRYYQQISSSTSGGNYMPYGTGVVAATTYAFIQVPILTAFRTSPTLTHATANLFRVGFTTCTTIALNSPSTTVVSLRCDVASGLTVGQAAQFDSNNNQTSFIGLSAEL